MKSLVTLLVSILALFSISSTNQATEYGGVQDYIFHPRIEVSVLGTGSMFPTFPKGTSVDIRVRESEVVAKPTMLVYPNGFLLNDQRYFSTSVHRGDIVSFKNAETDKIGESAGTGFIKRVVATPGDTLELRSGLVYLNGEPQKEPYTALPHSTFGGDFLTECKKLLIPENKVFVMGDNRKESDDSRFDVGLVDYSDIDAVLPTELQKGVWDKNYRNTSADLEESSKIKLNADKFVAGLNDFRKRNGVSALKVQSLLNRSAELRAKAVLKYNDFSFDGKISKYTMEDSMADAGYYNTTWGEIPVQGYYTEDEMLNYLIEFAKTRKFILNKEFSEIGISSVEGSLSGCPGQVIEVQLAGYIPPNYSESVINSWTEALKNLKDIQGSWRDLKKYELFYESHKKDVDRINEIIAYRIENIGKIVEYMNKDKWLTKEMNNYAEHEDSGLAKEQRALSEKLNGK